MTRILAIDTLGCLLKSSLWSFPEVSRPLSLDIHLKPLQYSAGATTRLNLSAYPLDLPELIE
jgi:hypothetical protein